MPGTFFAYSFFAPQFLFPHYNLFYLKYCFYKLLQVTTEEKKFTARLKTKLSGMILQRLQANKCYLTLLQVTTGYYRFFQVTKSYYGLLQAYLSSRQMTTYYASYCLTIYRGWSLEEYLGCVLLCPPLVVGGPVIPVVGRQLTWTLV